MISVEGIRQNIGYIETAINNIKRFPDDEDVKLLSQTTIKGCLTLIKVFSEEIKDSYLGDMNDV